MSYQPASKNSDVADLMSRRSLFQTQAAATTKARLPIIEERRMAAVLYSEADAAERKCFRPATSATRRITVV